MHIDPFWKRESLFLLAFLILALAFITLPSRAYGDELQDILEMEPPEQQEGDDETFEITVGAARLALWEAEKLEALEAYCVEIVPMLEAEIVRLQVWNRVAWATAIGGILTYGMCLLASR
jgi:hypothetical protein